jgi:hypothetical protein
VKFQTFDLVQLRPYLFWVITQRWLVAVYQRLGTAYRSLLPRVKQPKKMRPIDCPETSINNYNYKQRCVNPQKNEYFLLPFSLNFIIRIFTSSSSIFVSAYLSTLFLLFLSLRFSVYFNELIMLRLLNLNMVQGERPFQ